MRAFVVPNEQKANTGAIMEQLAALSQQYALELCCICEDDGSVDFPNISPKRVAQLKECDVILAVGGDGTIMHCARLSAHYGKPVMGINAGKLGFLAQAEPKYLPEYIRRLVAGEYTIEYRTALSAGFTGGQYLPIDFAINDIVITKIPEQNLATFESSCGGKKIDSYRADGLIFSTPTGSTAYSLSAGGPVIDPLIGAITLVPICPHVLSARPMVFAEQRVIAVCAQDSSLNIVADGTIRRTVEAGVCIQIASSHLRAGFITFHEQEFFEILTTKIKQRG